MKRYRDYIFFLWSPSGRYILIAFLAAIIIRIVVWFLLPPDYTHFSDERSYVEAGIKLAQKGEQDLFYPPLTGWLVAVGSTIFSSSSIRLLRFLWIIIDCANMLFLVVLCLRFSHSTPTVFPDGRGAILASSVLALYAVYPPFIGFSAFVVSETPALFLFLLVILFIGDPTKLSIKNAFISGLAAGFLVLTRSNLAGLVIAIPIFLVSLIKTFSRRTLILSAAAFVITASTVPALYVARNYFATGRLTLSDNSARHIYIGNEEIFQEDLNLFNPWPTKSQLASRKEYLYGNLDTTINLSPQEMQREGLRFISNNPKLFMRRALGRLARVFVPKTSQLDLLGGEKNAGVFTPSGFSLLLTGAIEYFFILLFGFAGLLCVDKHNRPFQLLVIASIVGCLPLSLVAVSTPRYSAQFEPLLMILMVFFIMDFRINVEYLKQKRKTAAIILTLFFIWAWIAWLIFSFASRIELLNL